MYGFIWGFHRCVRWPKCTPLSSSAFIVTFAMIAPCVFPPLSSLLHISAFCICGTPAQVRKRVRFGLKSTFSSLFRCTHPYSVYQSRSSISYSGKIRPEKNISTSKHISLFIYGNSTMNLMDQNPVTALAAPPPGHESSIPRHHRFYQRPRPGPGGCRSAPHFLAGDRR